MMAALGCVALSSGCGRAHTHVSSMRLRAPAMGGTYVLAGEPRGGRGQPMAPCEAEPQL